MYGQASGRSGRYSEMRQRHQLDRSRTPSGHHTLLFQLTCSPGPALPFQQGPRPRPQEAVPQPAPAPEKLPRHLSSFPGLVGPGFGARLSHGGRGNSYLLLLPLSWLTSVPLEPLTIPKSSQSLRPGPFGPNFLPGPAVASTCYLLPGGLSYPYPIPIKHCLHQCLSVCHFGMLG